MKRLICRLFGHMWSPPYAEWLGSEGSITYSTWCHRCGVDFVGDWYDMEGVKAWQHWR
jgi:hypothetical protein